MKKPFALLLPSILVLIILMAFRHYQSSLYYYAFEEKIVLTTVENKIILKFSSLSDKSLLNAKIKSIDELAQIDWRDDEVVVIVADDKIKSAKLIENLKQEKTIVSINPLFKTKDGLELGATNEFVFKLKPNVSLELINNLN